MSLFCAELAQFSGYDQLSWQPQDPNDSRRGVVLATVCNVSYDHKVAMEIFLFVLYNSKTNSQSP